MGVNIVFLGSFLCILSKEWLFPTHKCKNHINELLIQVVKTPENHSYLVNTNVIIKIILSLMHQYALQLCFSPALRCLQYLVHLKKQIRWFRSMLEGYYYNIYISRELSKLKWCTRVQLGTFCGSDISSFSLCWR